MKSTVDKSAVLDRLKKISNSSSDADLARFLGIAPATLSNWKSRDSIDYDLVFSKCVGISFDWLLTGSGVMSRSERPVVREAPTIIYKSDPKDLEMIKDKMRIIALQDDKIRLLEEKVAVQPAVLGSARSVDIMPDTGTQHPRK